MNGMRGRAVRDKSDSGVLEVAGQEFKVTSLGRVLYPATGTTKAEVIRYWAAVADVALPHLTGRPATRKRWPEGVDHEAFFAKDLEPGTPPWLTRVQIEHSGEDVKFYPVIDTPAGLAWLGQVSALELHVPQWRVDTPTGPHRSTTRSVRHPDRVVFDLDPGPGAGLSECVEVAVALREHLGPLGEFAVPVSSGSKGLHVYVPTPGAMTSTQASTWAHHVAQQLERDLPALVVSRMTKTLRTGKIFIDWSQNSATKTTIAPYSLRGRESPTVAAPRTWAELTEPGLRHLDYREVLDRVQQGLNPLAVLLEPPPALALAATADEPVHHPRPARAAVTRRSSAAVVPTPSDQTIAAGIELPADLAGPVDLELAKAESSIPGPHAMSGGTLYELKFDGYRGCLVAGQDGARLWSRQRNDLSASFPEIVAPANRLLPGGTVIDGEVCIWAGERLDFDRLQQRLGGGRTRIAQLAAESPASYIAFDLLALRGQDLRRRPLRERRALLEELAESWSPPLQLSPITDDYAAAQQWIELYLIWR